MYNIQGFYKIKLISNCRAQKEKIKKYLLSKAVKGTVILSPEGINGTVAGKKKDVNDCIKFIKNRFSIKSFDSNNENRLIRNTLHVIQNVSFKFESYMLVRTDNVN